MSDIKDPDLEALLKLLGPDVAATHRILNTPGSMDVTIATAMLEMAGNDADRH